MQYRGTARVSDARRMITAKDIFEVPRMVAQGFIAWTLPQAAWWPVSRLFAQLDVAMHPERTRQEVAQIEVAYVGTQIASEAHSACRRELGQSLRGSLPLFASLAAWRLGARDRDYRGAACVRGSGAGARHHFLGRNFQLQPSRQPRWRSTALGFRSAISAVPRTASPTPGSASAISTPSAGSSRIATSASGL